MLTIYNNENDSCRKVEVPDPPVNYNYAHYLQWEFKERLEFFRGRISRMSIAVFLPDEKGKYNGATLYAGRDAIKSTAITGLIIKLSDILPNNCYGT